MLAPTHIGMGVCSALLLAQFTGEDPTVGQWVALVAGSLAPDIDSRDSVIAKPGKVFSRFLPRGPLVLIDTLFTAISRTVNRAFGHRTVFHWPILAVSLILIGGVFEWIWLAWFGWGYLVHILGDFCTAGGAPLLGPFYCKNISWSPMKTASWGELCICALLWIGVCWLGYAHLPAETRKWLGVYASFLFEKT